MISIFLGSFSELVFLFPGKFLNLAISSGFLFTDQDSSWHKFIILKGIELRMVIFKNYLKPAMLFFFYSVTLKGNLNRCFYLKLKIFFNLLPITNKGILAVLAKNNNTCMLLFYHSPNVWSWTSYLNSYL